VSGPPLMFVTSNGERTLPAAFLRRCVVLELPSFDRARLLEIAAQHFPRSTSKDRAAVLDELVKLVPTQASGIPAIGTAEYLDVLRACLELNVRPGDSHWDQVSGAALVKRPIREG
jgi:MoxR-like ATPase